MLIFLLLLRDILLVLALNVVFLVPNVLVDMSKWLQRLMVRGKYCLLPAIWLYITEREDSDNGADVLLRHFPISEHPRNINRNLSLFSMVHFFIAIFVQRIRAQICPRTSAGKCWPEWEDIQFPARDRVTSISQSEDTGEKTDQWEGSCSCSCISLLRSA